MEDVAKQALLQAQEALKNFSSSTSSLSAVAKAAKILADSFKAGGRAFSCGNGGSMCDAMHFAEELSGRFRKDRRAFAAVAISDPGHLSCVANDFGWEFVFSRYLEAHARMGDVLLAISTSGKSPNVLRAAELAKTNGVHVIALTGVANSPLSKSATVDICAAGGGAFADRVQELHIKIIHILIELVERELCPQNY